MPTYTSHTLPHSRAFLIYILLVFVLFSFIFYFHSSPDFLIHFFLSLFSYTHTLCIFVFIRFALHSLSSIIFTCVSHHFTRIPTHADEWTHKRAQSRSMRRSTPHPTACRKTSKTFCRFCVSHTQLAAAAPSASASAFVVSSVSDFDCMIQFEKFFTRIMPVVFLFCIYTGYNCRYIYSYLHPRYFDPRTRSLAIYIVYARRGAAGAL